MSELIEGLAQTIGGDTIAQLANALGADKETTSKAVAVALPAILGGLANNTRSRSGAASLFDALLNEHDGSILGSLGSLFGSGQAPSDGQKILGHVFGQQEPQVVSGIQQASGLDKSLVMRLLPLLAPVVLGYIGNKIRSGALSQNDLAAELQYERAEVKQQDSVLGSIFDMVTGGADAPKVAAQEPSIADIAANLATSSAGKAILGALLK